MEVEVVVGAVAEEVGGGEIVGIVAGTDSQHMQCHSNTDPEHTVAHYAVEQDLLRMPPDLLRAGLANIDLRDTTAVCRPGLVTLTIRMHCHSNVVLAHIAVV